MRKLTVSFFFYEIIYVEYCLLQQYGLKIITHLKSIQEIYVGLLLCPLILTCAFFFLLWELRRAQSHTSLEGLPFTFCSRTWRNFMSALIGSCWTYGHFPWTIRYESWSPCKSKWRAVRGAVCKGSHLLAIVNFCGAPANQVLENGDTVPPANFPPCSQSHPLGLMSAGGIWWKWSIKLGVLTFDTITTCVTLGKITEPLWISTGLQL